MAELTKLATEGPLKKEQANRRVRLFLGGQFLFDTNDALFVWEHKYYPHYYIPRTAIEAGPATLDTGARGAPGETDVPAWQTTLRAPSGDLAEVVVFEQGPLAGLVKFANPAQDKLQFFEEDQPVLGPHPRDPYKRVECLPSSREVRIELAGTVLAKSTDSVFLLETGLRRRYYMHKDAMTSAVALKHSANNSMCPYKGKAGYYHVEAGGKLERDAVWYYSEPTNECLAVKDLICFYNERFDVFVDGVKE